MAVKVTDIKLFRVLANLGSIIGIFPVESLKTASYKYSYRSVHGCIAISFFFLKVSVFGLVGPFLVHTINTPMPAVGITTFTNPSFDHHFIQVLYYSVLLLSVTMQFEFMRLLPRFLKLYNKLLDYRDKYGVSGDCSLFQIIKSSSCLMLFLIEGFVHVYYLRRRMNNLESKEGTFETYGFSISCKNLNVLTIATFILFHFSMVYALACFFIFTFMIEQRLLRIQQLLRSDVFLADNCTLKCRDPHLQKWGQDSWSQKIAVASEQIIDLKEIFSFFNKSVQLFILIFMSFGTVTLTVTVYCYLSTLSRVISNNSPSVYLSSSLLLALIFKLFWLTDCGERIANGVSFSGSVHFHM